MDSSPRFARSAPLALSLRRGRLVAACAAGSSGSISAGATAPTPAASASASAGSSAAPSASAGTTKLTVGLGYVPNVQFAPFYLAQQAGYYRDAGLDVTFQNKIDPELITLVGQGAVDMAIADGTSLIPAVSQGITVKYVATIYAKFPNIVFAKPTAGITTAADLKGKKIGTPGKYGSGWIMLQALLSSAGLTTERRRGDALPDLRPAGRRGAGPGRRRDRVREQRAGPAARRRPASSRSSSTSTTIVPLPGNGLITGTTTLATKRDAVALFISATLRAMDEISADPQKGLDAAIVAIPELGLRPRHPAGGPPGHDRRLAAAP